MSDQLWKPSFSILNLRRLHYEVKIWLWEWKVYAVRIVLKLWEKCETKGVLSFRIRKQRSLIQRRFALRTQASPHCQLRVSSPFPSRSHWFISWFWLQNSFLYYLKIAWAFLLCSLYVLLHLSYWAHWILHQLDECHSSLRSLKLIVSSWIQALTSTWANEWLFRSSFLNVNLHLLDS